jgi:hypothetical protein
MEQVMGRQQVPNQRSALEEYGVNTSSHSENMVLIQRVTPRTWRYFSVSSSHAALASSPGISYLLPHGAHPRRCHHLQASFFFVFLELAM